MAATALFTVGGQAFTLGNALTVGTTLMSMGATAAQYDAQIAAARYNATLAQQEASQESNRRRQQGARQLAAIRQARAKSGVTFEGSPLLVAAESAAQIELDALNAQMVGRSEKQLHLQRAKGYRSGRTLAVGTSLLKGGGSLLRSWSLSS